MTKWIATQDNASQDGASTGASAEAVARREEEARVKAKNELMVNAKKLFEESASQVLSLSLSFNPSFPFYFTFSFNLISLNYFRFDIDLINV